MASGGDGVSPEDQALTIAQDILSRLPAAVLEGAGHGTVSAMDPMAVVVVQEAARYEKLLRVLKSSSRAVIGAVQGK